jgi:hypothetical protein
MTRQSPNWYANDEQAIRWLPFINESGEKVPAYGLLGLGIRQGLTTSESHAGPPLTMWSRPDGDDGDVMLRAGKPGTGHARAQNPAYHAFNGPEPVRPGKRGRCTMDFPARCLVHAGALLADGSENDPYPGQPVGPQADSWYLWSGGSTFILHGWDLSGAVGGRVPNNAGNMAGAVPDGVRSYWISTPIVKPEFHYGYQTGSPEVDGHEYGTGDSITTSGATYRATYGCPLVHSVSADSWKWIRHARVLGTVSATLVNVGDQGSACSIGAFIERDGVAVGPPGMLAWRRQQNEVDQYGTVLVQGAENVSFPFVLHGSPGDVLHIRNLFANTRVENFVMTFQAFPLTPFDELVLGLGPNAVQAVLDRGLPSAVYE